MGGLAGQVPETSVAQEPTAREQPCPHAFPTTQPGGSDRGDGLRLPPMLTAPVAEGQPPPCRERTWGNLPASQTPPSVRPRVLQEWFPSRQEKPYPGWVLAACALLSFLPTLWVPMVALGQLLAWCREKTRNPPQDGRPKPRGSRAC